MSLPSTGDLTPNYLAPPDPPVPFSPPPVPRSSQPECTPALPIVTTNSPNQHQNISRAANSSPSIVISGPSVSPSTLIDASRTIPSPAPIPSPALPRIGTPKRPYYTTVRASMNGRPSSSVSQFSTPPASPASPTFSNASAGRSRSPASYGMPGSPDSSASMNRAADALQRPTSMVMDCTVPRGDDVAMTHRPASTPAIVTVPPLPPVVNPPLPIPIPVQMHMRPSSPVRSSILSVLDPAQCVDEDEEMENSQFGMRPSHSGKALRERKSGNLKNKDKGRGDAGKGSGYHFPLSLSLSLGRKRGRGLGAFGLASEKEKEPIPPLPTLSSSRSYTGIGPSRGCSMSGEMELRMALAERNINANSNGEKGLKSAFKFRENQRPSYDGEGSKGRGKSGGRRLMKMRSSIGLSSSRLLPSSPPSSPSKPKIGSKLKEMSIHFLGKLQGSDANHS